MSRSFDTELVISIAREVVEQIAPDELRLFPSISEAYAREPDRILKQRAALDKSLGFGPGELVPVLTLAILPIIQQALGQIATDATEKGAGTLLSRLRRAMFGRSSSRKLAHAPSPPEFSSAELILIQHYVYKAALQRKFTEANAQQFADTVVARLATGKAETEKI